MADQDTEVSPAVEYKAQSQEAEAVEIRSPAKNRYKGTILNASKSPGENRLPKLFERVSRKWWDPQFDSEALEKQLISSYFQQTRRRFQYALSYIIIACIAWCIFFAAVQEVNWIPFLAGSVVLLVICLVVLGFTFSNIYERLLLPTSIVVSILLYGFCLLNFILVGPVISAVGTFTGMTEILLLLYTVIPLPLCATIIIGVLYSITFEVLSGTLTSMSGVNYIIGRALLHVCIHMIGIHIFLMSQSRKRSTFLKVGQSIMSRRDLELEKQLKQRMIHSLMPPKVAEEIMKSREKEEKQDEENEAKRHHHTPTTQRGQITFRSFHMSQLSNVSILFADIVGFTNMSSNKTAEHLVSLLNDLFGRFDVLCTKCGCEKISTLGDCYYCVSGCPEPRVDHAQCCIEMGLGMVKAIQMFDEDHNEQVNMRVGVHTGTVLCGLVGTRRFKFDVWSNDVTLANMMESEGKPGLVHISDSTYAFVKEDYEVEGGEDVEDIRKHKVLIEDYNTETQQYQVRHVQDQDSKYQDIIKTYFIVNRKHPIQVGLTSPASPRDKTDGESAESVKIAMEDKEDTQTPSQETSTQGAPVSPTSDSNHVNGQTDANGMSPALLLGRRDNLTTSLEEIAGEKDDSKEVENDAALLKQLKQQRVHSDKALISCMETDMTAQEYLLHPPINQCTLNFLNSHYESEYHNHYLADKIEGASTFASPRVSAFFDMAVSFLFLILISAGCFLGFPIRPPWIIVFSVAILLEFLMLLPLIVDVWVGGRVATTVAKFSRFLSSWYPRHIFGAVLASLPVIAVYANFSCYTFYERQGSDIFYCLMVVVSLLHYCNFTMLSSWMKSTLATIAGLILLILLGIGVCNQDLPQVLDTNATLAYVAANQLNNISLTTMMSVPFREDIFYGDHQLRFEIILSMALLLLLIWFLNREFEISYRLSFHGDLQALLDHKKMQTEKEQADWLLHNIIPQHVSDVLKKTSKYCKNHTDVGVIFAKVINFDDFYDESFKGGREYLRVLNELIGDFEDLFDDPKYKDVEKIKTIGSCLMAASGLNPNTRNQNKDPKAHLYALMDFSVDLLGKLEQFNMEIFNFDFEMSIGYNTGEVTAGVIGTTKLLYDIWGDTVNISSRMYSTGVHGRVQVTEDTATKLSDKCEFEYRGQTYVKGKGDMNTYLFVKNKEGATWD